jgi:hypothetical protein
MNNDLKNLFLTHKGKLSDKWSFYIEKWDNIYSPFKDQEINLLEIGSQNGGSLEIWAKYFQKANNIIGCDIEQDCQNLVFSDSRISIIIGDANTDDVEQEITEKSPGYDIIIDDGSHKSSDIIKSFARYFKLLNDGGIYVIEDLHASYWKEFEGGLYTPYSAIAFMKRLADITNFEHWRNSKHRIDHLNEYDRKFGLQLNEFDLCRIQSVLFTNSLCIIHKNSPNENTLGTRIVVGHQEEITTGFEKLDGTSINDNVTSFHDDSNLDIFAAQHEIQRLKDQLVEKEQEISFYSESTSWKITKPLRMIMKFIRKVAKNE